MRCIYCGEQKNRGDFNREHVLPEGFGRFQNALVLHDAVCSECNDYFGRHLDFALARSSSEGLERYSWHLKAPAEVDRFRYGDVLIRLKAPDTEWDDALIRKVPSEVLGESRIELIPQAIFRKKDGSGVTHVPLWDLRRGEWRSDASLDLQSGVRVLAPRDLFDEVVSVLEAHGLSFKAATELDAPQAEDNQYTVQHLFALTDTLQRAVAKVGFNYFAYANGADIALRPEFDAIRSFVRNATPTRRPVVSVLATTRLGIARADGQVPVVHYLTTELDDSDTALLAHVTLFHWAVYQVVLAEQIPLDLAPKSSGHLFNLSDMTCYEMTRRARP